MTVAGRQLVGREEELEALVGLLEAPEHPPLAAVLAGDPGIGKTALWLTAIEAAATGGYRVLTSRPSETEAPFSFVALADLLEGVLAEVLPELPGMQRRALEAALALSDADGGHADEGVVAFAFRETLRRLAGEGPLLLAVDDVQWLDGPSLALLRYALPRLDGEPIVALLTVRGEVPTWLRRTLPEERLLALELRGLSLGALHELLRARLGAGLLRPTLRRVWETSGGNPFYALELARALQRRGGRVAPGEELPISADLDALVHERLDRLSPEALEVARVVAALAEPTVSLVEAAVGDDASTGLRDALLSRVLELDAQRLRFTHPLLASAVAIRADPAQRRALHARVAAVAPDPEEHARHLALAASGPDPAVAAALDDAARRARSRGAPGAAADLAEQALRLTPPEDSDEIRARTVDAADHVFVSGDPARAIALLEAALAEAPPGRPRGAILRRLANVRGEAIGVREAVALYRDALEQTGGDAALEAQIHLDLAAALRLTSSMSSAEPHARAAVRAAERVGDDELLCRALSLCGLIHFNLGRGIDDELMKRALALEESLEGPVQGMGAKASLYDQLRWTDDLDRARALGEDARAALHARDDPFEANALALLSLIEWRAGNWSRAAELADAQHALHEESGRTALRPMQEWPRTVIAAHRGRVDEARVVAAECVALADEAGSPVTAELHRWILGFVELSRGNPAAALEQLRPARELRESLELLEPGSRLELPDLLEALVAVGELDEAEAALAPWEERARDLDRAWALAIAARCRALVLAARGDLDGALATFATALAEHERAQDPFQHARTLLALGATERRAKRRAAARATLERALATFDALPAPLWADKARAELARIGGRAPGSGELTATERRVAALAAEGRSTKEVAGVLFVSASTVEKHLTRIYAKLGVRSRAELAHRLSAQAEPK
jgi:DNA-binding CsgD family transcriptional regulator